MRSEDEEDEDEYEEVEEDEEQPAGDDDEEEAEGDDDEDADGDGNDEDEEGGDEGDEDDDDEGEEGEDEDEDEAEEGEGDEDEEDGEGDVAKDDEEDVDMESKEPASSPQPSHRSKATTLKTKRPLSPSAQPPPPHRIRRSLLIPSWAPSKAPTSLSLDAMVAIPIPAPVHCLAATACSSYLLAGSQEGFVRAYDFYASVNGQQSMTALQKAAIAMGEGISKVGVTRGWWANEVPGLVGGEKKVEPVYSMACEGDGLWAATGSQSGPINLYTLRHSPGHLLHSLKGHTNVVSCMTLLPDDKHLLSGSWDGTVREWDLNTGQSSRMYPTHGAQLSSISLRPYSHPISPSPSLRDRAQEDGDDDQDEEQDGQTKLDVSVSVGPDFFEPKPTETGEPDVASTERQANGEDGVRSDAAQAGKTGQATEPDTQQDPPARAASPNRNSRGSSYDPLFDDLDADAEGEEAPISNSVTQPQSPNSASQTRSSVPAALALPSAPKANGVQTSTNATAGPSRLANAGAAANIPLLSPTSYRQFSDDILLASFMDGQVSLIDRRVSSKESGEGRGVGRLLPGDKAPPWCMSACWSGDGNLVLAGRRNGTVDVWDVRRSSSSTAPNLLRTLRTPTESSYHGGYGGSQGSERRKIRGALAEETSAAKKTKSSSKPPFKIVAGHHGGTISSMLVDPTCRFLTTASGDRGWAGESTKLVLVHEIKW